MSKRKIKYIPKSFESQPNFLPKKKNGNNATDVSANIYMSMLLSPAWNNLTKNQQILYVYCKAQYYGEKKTNAEHLTIQEKEEKANVNTDMRFTMNKSKWCDIYGIYSESGKRHFYKDMRALIDNGFIEIVENGKVKSRPNIYAFSDKWTETNKQKARIIEDTQNTQSIKKWSLYKHIVPNNKIYYGVTSQIPCNKRWNYGRGYIKNRQFYEDIKKYGWNNIKHEIIYRDLSTIEAACYEYALILRDETYKEKNGYNHESVNINKFIKSYIHNDSDYKKLNNILIEILNKHIKDIKV